MKKRIGLILGTIILIIIGYLVMTPMGALRLALLRTGFPIKAITLQVSDHPYEVNVQSNEKIYTLKNPPTEEATQGVLENWIVSKHGIFYVGEYFGW